MGQEIGKTDLTELRRLHEAATKGVFWQEEVAFSEACKVHLPALLDELEAAREEVRRLKCEVSRAKLIGAAEELEAVDPRWFTDILNERAAQLRREAE